MPIHFYTRYGAQEHVRDRRRYKRAIRELVDELCEEQFARPDYEHCEVSVGTDDGWFIAATMQGFVTFGRVEGGREPERYLYGLAKEDLVGLMMLLADGKMDAVLARDWRDSAAAVRGPGDHYLLRNHPDLTDLHRAAAKGDCDWIRRELSAGTPANARDRHGATPLHWAALAGRPDACRLLIAEGADAASRDNRGASVAEYGSLSREYIGPQGAQELVAFLRSAGKQ